MSARDCCKGEPAYGDPRGLHSEDCPEYLEQMAALEARQARKLGDVPPLAQGGIVRPSGESTSAALRRVTAERDALIAFLRETQELAKDRNEGQEPDALHVAYERELARLRAAAEQSEREHDLARAELASAREELERLRAGRSWIVARDGGRDCLDCDREIRRGEAYELVPGEGLDALRHVHCPPKEKSMTTNTTDGGERPSISPEEHYAIGEHLLRGCEALAEVDHPAAASQAAIAHAHFTAAAAGAAMRGMELMLHPQQTVQAEPPPAVEHGENGEPWRNAATEQYEVACLCGETFTGDRAYHAGERLLVHLGRKATDV